jgi:sugar-specific transcriptional regulator TrmB
MLAFILKSKIASEVTINIMDIFVKMRKYISNNILTNKILINHESRILKLENTLDKLNKKEKINTIFCKGQIYDANSLFLDILNKAKNEIIIIDN